VCLRFGGWAPRVTNHVCSCGGGVVLSRCAVRSLYLSHNAFTGSVPPSLAACQELAYLDVSHNQLSGTLSSDLASLVTNAGPGALFDFRSNLPSLTPSAALAKACAAEGSCYF
jgi:hypothetical protein